MAIKHVLVHVEPGPASQARLNYAVELARRFGASLTGLAVTLPPTETAFAMMGDAQLYSVAIEAAQESTAMAKAQFSGAARACELSTRWRDCVGNPVDVVCAEAGCADLLVVGRQDQRDPDGSFYTLSPADLLMTCGRPVLVVPEKAPARFKADRVLVGWKNTPESARAAHDALPFLVTAESVILAEVVSSGGVSDRHTIAVEDMADHLRAHGAPVEVRKVSADAVDAGKALIDLTVECGADLIVAGAYGHSRFREWALGGVTRSLLHEAPTPCLFSR
jgi:nucleotide-binding universal stress UspA family protein